MAHIKPDRVREFSQSTGTGNFILSGAVTSFRAFASVASVNDTFFYTISSLSLNEWEVGIGTYSAANTLTRTTIISSSNSGSAVNFSAGDKDVFITAPGSKFLQADNNGSYGDFSAGIITASLTGTASNNLLKSGDTMTGRLILNVTGRSATIGSATTQTPESSIANQTSYLELVAGTGSATSSSGLVFHNPNTSTAVLEYVNSDNNNGYFNFRSDDTTWNARINGNTIWHAGNDGSTSGLDADLLDGQHGSYYQAASTALTTSTFFGGDVSGTYNAIVVADNSHNHTSLTGVTSIAFATEISDFASISTTIDGSATYFDFNLTDDNNNDYWRWRFTPAGSTVYDAMKLKSSANGFAELTVNGLLTATQKSFTINHPTKPGMKLRYGSLEGPENGVYVRGKIKGKVIELPEYWTKLVDPDSITVQLTAIGKGQKLYVEDIRDNKVYINNEGLFSGEPYCFYYILAERADVEKLQVEIE